MITQVRQTNKSRLVIYSSEYVVWDFFHVFYSPERDFLYRIEGDCVSSQKYRRWIGRGGSWG